MIGTLFRATVIATFSAQLALTVPVQLLFAAHATASDCAREQGRTVTSKEKTDKSPRISRTCEEEGTVFVIRAGIDSNGGKRGPAYSEISIAECGAVYRTGAGHCLAIWRDNGNRVRRISMPVGADAGMESVGGASTGRTMSIADIARGLESSRTQEAMRACIINPTIADYTPAALDQIADAFQEQAHARLPAHVVGSVFSEERLNALADSLTPYAADARTAAKDLRSASEIRQLAAEAYRLEWPPVNPQAATHETRSFFSPFSLTSGQRPFVEVSQGSGLSTRSLWSHVGAFLEDAGKFDCYARRFFGQPRHGDAC